jgi:hypothetical protein
MCMGAVAGGAARPLPEAKNSGPGFRHLVRCRFTASNAARLQPTDTNNSTSAIRQTTLLPLPTVIASGSSPADRIRAICLLEQHKSRASPPASTTNGRTATERTAVSSRDTMVFRSGKGGRAPPVVRSEETTTGGTTELTSGLVVGRARPDRAVGAGVGEGRSATADPLLPCRRGLGIDHSDGMRADRLGNTDQSAK